MAANVAVVMVMSVVVGVVQDGGMLMRVAEGVAELWPVVVVAAGQTVATGLLACLVARWWERVLMATRQTCGCAVTQRATLLPTLAHIWTLLMA